MRIYMALSYAIPSDLRYYGEYIKRPLASFWSIKQTKKAVQSMIESKKKYLIDSGGYSAFTKNAIIDIDDYINFVKDNKDMIENYFNLDDITDSKKTLENQAYIESKGLDPIPVFHYGEDFKILKAYLKKYKYIALGGLVPHSGTNNLYIHLDNCFAIIKDYFPVKIHCFGITSYRTLKRYPFYSADSTSAFGGSMRPTINNHKGQKLKYQNNIDALLTKDKGDKKNYKERVIYIMKSICKMEDEITKLWTIRGIIWKD
jgi:hypothetical protein